MPVTEANNSVPKPPAPLLIDIQILSDLLGRSVDSLQRDDEAGRIPRPIRINKAKRWRTNEIRHWVLAGCPDRATWEARFPTRAIVGGFGVSVLRRS